jgi:hypothetical protein
MRNPLISSLVVVVLFWWGVLFCAWLYQLPQNYQNFHLLSWLSEQSFRLTGNYLIAFVALVTVAGLSWGNRKITYWILKGRDYRGAVSTIGSLPGVLSPARVQSAEFDRTLWPALAKWHDSAPNNHKQLFNAILTVLAAKMDHPASPVKGGHGDTLLITHSLNVADALLVDAGKWRLDRPDHPLHDRPLEKDEPLLVLIGMAHDLGKLETFLKKGDGYESRPNGLSHDAVSGLILARLPESWALPEEERLTINMVVVHRHHPAHFPTHLSERAHLLLEYLIDIDVAVSAKEGAGSNAATVTPTSVPSMPVQPVASTSAPSMSGQPIAATGNDLWDWFIQTLAMPGSINGNDSNNRIGFKVEYEKDQPLLLLNEVMLRPLIAEQVHKDVQLAKNQKKDGRSELTLELMRLLDEKGLLVTEYAGASFSAESAFWQAEAIDPVKNRVLTSIKAGFLVRITELLPNNIQNLNPAAKPPIITAPLFPQRRKRSKAPESQKDDDSQDPNVTLVMDNIKPGSSMTDKGHKVNKPNKKATKESKKPNPENSFEPPSSDSSAPSIPAEEQPPQGRGIFLKVLLAYLDAERAGYTLPVSLSDEEATAALVKYGEQLGSTIKLLEKKGICKFSKGRANSPIFFGLTIKGASVSIHG